MAWDPHLLPAGQAASGANCYLFSGALQGWRAPKLLRQLQNSAAKFAFRIPTVSQTTATAYLLFVGSGPNSGDTVTVGEDTYTFQTNVQFAYDVQVAASAAVSAANLLAALTGDNGTYTNEGTLYGTNTILNGDIATTGNNQGVVIIGGTSYTFLQLLAPDIGSAYNETNVSATGLGLLWLQDLLSDSHTTANFSGGTNPSFDNTITAPSTWLEFLDPDTNVVKSQVVDDTFNRYYMASPSLLPQYNTYNRIVAGKPPFTLGINPPGCAPGVSVSGGGNVLTLPTNNQTSDNNIDYANANTCYLVPILTPGATQLNDVQFVSPAPYPTVNYVGVVYADDNPESNIPTFPGELVTNGNVVLGLTVGVNGLSTFTNPVPLLANTVYWIGIMVDTTIQVFEANGSATSFQFNTAFANGPPATAPGGSASQIDLQMWADMNTDDVLEDRAYLYTWVSAYGEESPPSPPTTVTGWSNGTWTIGLFNPPNDDLGANRNLAILRLYRTVSGVSGSTVYFFVADISLGSTDPDAISAVANDALTCLPPTTSYLDTVLDNVVSLNLQLPSTTFFPPPENLQGILNLPNGMVAGFKSNEIWFCNPYQPHAWPPGYVLTTDFPIVGIGMTQGALVAATGANSYVAVGVSPASMSLLKCAPPDPCLSRGSILSSDFGVMYMSPNGLIQVTNTGTSTNTTEPWITRERWQQLTPQKYGRAIPLVGCYFCFGTEFNGDNSVAQEGFTIQLMTDSSSFTIWPQPGGHRVGFMLLSSPLGFDIDNVLIDQWTGVGVLIQNGGVYYYDFSDPAPTMTPYTWRSKVYQQNTKKNYSAMKMFFSVPTGTAPYGTRNTLPASDSSWQTLEPDQLAIIRTYVDIGTDVNDNPNGSMVLIDCREVQQSGELLRIVSGFKCEQWQWEVTGRVVVSNIQVATTAKELGNV